ncbi:unnamed protein product, partial [Choristocarpus tenellus]
HFDEASPEQTLTSGRGHSNPKGALFASMSNAVGIEAHQHFVRLHPSVLDGVLPNPLPPALLHSFVEEEVGDGYISVRVDGYVADRSLFDAAKQLLNLEGKSIGYRIRSDGTVEWDGKSDCFCQMVDSAVGKPLEREGGGGQVTEDLGCFDDPVMSLYRTEANFQRLPFLVGLLFGVLARGINRRIDIIR